jgi:hypothetical protein
MMRFSTLECDIPLNQKEKGQMKLKAVQFEKFGVEVLFSEDSFFYIKLFYCNI